MTTTDPLRERLFPDPRKTNPRRKGALIYNAYDQDKLLRYQVQREASRIRKREIVDPGYFLFDLHWRTRVVYDKNERPIWLAMKTRNEAFRREIAMYDEKPTGLLRALLEAQQAFHSVSMTADLLGQAQVNSSADTWVGLVDSGRTFREDIDLALKRYARPLLARFDAKMREGRERLIEHARRKPKMWETPLDMPPALGWRWRIEGDLLAVVALRPLPTGLDVSVDAYVTRRVPYRPYKAWYEAPALAAERAAKLVGILTADSAEGTIARGRLLAEGDDWLSDRYLHADEKRTPRDIRRAVAARMLRRMAWRKVDLSDPMIDEGIDYVIKTSRERDDGTGYAILPPSSWQGMVARGFKEEGEEG